MAKSEKKNTFVIVLIVFGVLALVGVVCAGVLAAIAIPAFTKYIKKSKEAEVGLNLRTIANGASSYYENAESSAFPPSVGLTPSKSCCDYPEGKCPAGSKKWSKKPWKDIHFEPFSSHYYQYSMDNQGDTLVVKAVGDLDCDGNMSEWTITLKASDGAVNTSPVELVQPE